SLKVARIGVARNGVAAAGQKRGAPLLIAMMGAILAVYVIRPWLALRPQLFTYALFPVFLALLAGARRERNPAWFTPMVPLTAVWANLHAGALLAPALLFIEVAGSVLDNVRAEILRPTGKHGETADWIWTGWLGGMTALVLFATLLTPHGLAFWSYPGKVIGHPIVTDFITEWQSPNFHASGLYPFAVLCYALIAALILSGPRPPYRDYLLLGLLLALAMVYKRNIPLFALAACPVLVGRGWEVLERWRWPLRIPFPWIGAGACLFSLIPISGAARHWPSSHSLFASQAGLHDLPVEAVEFLKRYPLPGPLFNEYRWGGYLIWHLPQAPVFIDGRAEVYYRKSVFDDFVAIHRMHPGWKEVLEKHRIRVVLAEHRMPYVRALMQDPAWTAVYQDPQAVVLIRVPYSDPPLSPGG
ncbi:MAG: hypothetical protein KY468_10435, partial [Armatimonadetes bacterium]|nr:hypothetical protein [Armatimonadota bacterium]